MLARMWRKRNTPPLLVGLQACTTTLEISLAVPQKIGHSTTRGSSNTSPGHISRCSNHIYVMNRKKFIFIVAEY
ncbi:mCG148248 [Mus musculus]|nr:mCG148248 [Mus musculus]